MSGTAPLLRSLAAEKGGAVVVLSADLGRCQRTCRASVSSNPPALKAPVVDKSPRGLIGHVKSASERAPMYQCLFCGTPVQSPQRPLVRLLSQPHGVYF